jgi:hypothetical protein
MDVEEDEDEGEESDTPKAQGKRRASRHN